MDHYAYIISNANRTLYVGMTSDLVRHVEQHKRRSTIVVQDVERLRTVGRGDVRQTFEIERVGTLTNPVVAPG